MLFIDQRAPRGDEDAGSRQMLSYLKLFAGRGYSVVFWSFEGNDDPQAVRELKSLGIQVLRRVPYIFRFEDWIKLSEKISRWPSSVGPMLHSDF
jgi:hypothetical protein